MKHRVLGSVVSLCLLSGCAAFWPWMYAKEVEEAASVSRSVRATPVTRKNYLTRSITKQEKQFDANHDGFLQADELVYLHRARRVREQEKFLRGER